MPNRKLDAVIFLQTCLDIYDGMSKLHRANPSPAVPEQEAALRSPVQCSTDRLEQLRKPTIQLLTCKVFLQDGGKFALQHAVAQRNLHECLYHLQSVFYKRTLSVVWFVSVQGLMPATSPCHNASPNSTNSKFKVAQVHPIIQMT
jgi:hypothetical protein